MTIWYVFLTVWHIFFKKAYHMVGIHVQHSLHLNYPMRLSSYYINIQLFKHQFISLEMNSNIEPLQKMKTNIYWDPSCIPFTSHSLASCQTFSVGSPNWCGQASHTTQSFGCLLIASHITISSISKMNIMLQLIGRFAS